MVPCNRWRTTKGTSGALPQIPGVFSATAFASSAYFGIYNQKELGKVAEIEITKAELETKQFINDSTGIQSHD
jgi:hypothetical protein